LHHTDTLPLTNTGIENDTRHTRGSADHREKTPRPHGYRKRYPAQEGALLHTTKELTLALMGIENDTRHKREAHATLPTKPTPKKIRVLKTIPGTPEEAQTTERKPHALMGIENDTQHKRGHSSYSRPSPHLKKYGYRKRYPTII